MKVCYVPGRESTYSRTRTFINGLKKNKVELIDCSSAKKSSRRYFEILSKFLKNRKKADIVLVGFLGQHLMLIIKKFTRKKIVFDAFLSVYDTMVFDKKITKQGSLKAKIYFWLDKKSCTLADIILLDTNQHIEYFHNTFNIKKEKFRRVLIGADESLFYPREEKKHRDFIVEFHGEFIPLQGTKYIVQAAKLLEKHKDIKFNMIGKGQTSDKALKLSKKLNLQNITFLGWKNPEEIPLCISEADVGLGIFGETEKTRRVIPNKAYEIIAMKKPLITADTPAIRELFEHKKNAFLCEIKSPESIANAVLELKNNRELRNNIAKNGYETYKNYGTSAVIGKQLKEICEELV